jgi:hypothetical protein
VSSRVVLYPGTEVFRPVRTTEAPDADGREAIVVEFPQRQDASVCPVGCVRGVQFALAIEAVAALAIYGIWQVYHLLH